MYTEVSKTVIVKTLDDVTGDTRPAQLGGQIIDRTEQAEFVYESAHVDYDARGVETLDKMLPDWRWIAAYAVPGSNEGYYVHVDVISSAGRKLLVSFKCLGTFQEANSLAAAVNTIINGAL